MSLLPDLTPTHALLDGVWRPRAARADYAYSDGEAIESAIAKIVAGATDRSLTSPELAAGITDFATRYHLSPERANLLRPLEPLLTGKRVLELGAGCGAITRYLGELGAIVTAVEGSERRAQIIATRCHDLPNVQIVCDRIEEFLRGLPPETQFDAVLLVGVLEYAPRYIDAADPVQALLQLVAARVAPNGAAIVAIENQLGLKYFAGAPEDHLGVPMHGIQDAYGAKDVVTFGRGELAARMAQAGLGTAQTYLPLPDYKLPTSVLAPSLQEVEIAVFDPTALVRQAVQSDPQLSPTPLFSLERALGPIMRNGLLAEVANSLLLVAQRQPQPMDQSVLAWHYSARRRPEYGKATHFVRAGKKVTVRRAPLYPNQSVPTDAALLHQLADEIYQPGVLWSDSLGEIVTQPHWTLQQVAGWARRWLVALDAELKVKATATELPGSALDLLPQNMIVAADGVVTFIDREWTAVAPLPRGYVLFRGLVNSLFALTAFAAPADPRYATAGPLLEDLLTALGQTLTRALLDDCAARESQLNVSVYGPKPPLDYRADIAARIFPRLLDLAAQATLQQRATDSAQAMASLQVEHHAALDARQQFEAAAALRLKEIATLEGQLAAQRHAAADAHAQLQAALVQQTAQLETVQGELAAQRHAANDMQGQLQQALATQTEQLATLQAQLAAQRHAEHDSRAQLQNALELQRERVLSLETELAARQHAAQDAAGQLQAALAMQAEQAQAREAVLAAQHHAALDAQAQLQSALDQQRQQAMTLESERLAQIHAANDTRQQVETLLQARLDQIAALEVELGAARHAAADTRTQLEALVATQAAQLVEQATATKTVQTALANSYAELVEQQTAHEQATLLAQQSLAAAREEITTLDARLSVQTIQHDALQTAHEALTSQSLVDKAEIDNLLTAQTKLDNALADERTLRASAERRLTDREAELKALLQSSSWRLTKPLRFAAHTARAVAAKLSFARSVPVDAAAPHAVTPGAVRYSIDYLNIKGDRLYMFGWAFHAGEPIVAAELIVHSGGKTVSFDGTYATARPDVAEALKLPEAGPSGFRLGCKLPAVREEGGTLRFRLADGRAADFPVAVIAQRATAPIRRHRLRRGLQLARRGQILPLLKKSMELARRRRDLAGDTTQAGFATLVAAIRTGRPVGLPLDHQAAAFLRQLSAWHDGRVPVTILFDHQLGGGANHYRHALLAGETYRDRAVLLFTYDVASSQPVALLRPLGNSERSDEAEWLRVPAPGLDIALEAMGGFTIAELFLNNIYSFEAPIALLRSIGRLRKQSGGKLRIAAHDHFGICPSYTLLNHQDNFCNVPKSLSVCRNCLSQHKGEFTWLMEVPDIGLWRTVWQHTLQAADEILVFSRSTRTLYQKAYRRLDATKFTIIPHAIDHVQAAPVPVDHSAPLHIGIVGHISVLKGAHVVRSLCEAIVASGANARVTIIGSLQIDYRSPVLTVTGTYVPQDLPRLITQHGVNLAFFSSICPETFSYVTAELMQLALPILAFDVGAPAERLAEYAQGRVVPLAEQHAVLDHLLRFHADLAAEAALAATSASVSDLNKFRERAARETTQGRGQP